MILMSLKGKVALVTGSTSGIGLAIARAFAGAGCSVMMNGLAEGAALHKLAGELAGESGMKVACHPADMTRPAEIADLVATTQATLGGLDILVNNAGIQHVDRIEKFPVEKWDAIIAVNLSASFHTVRAALPAMKESGWGRIINIASTHGLVASTHKAAYVAAKHGLIGLTLAVPAVGRGVGADSQVRPGAGAPGADLAADEAPARLRRLSSVEVGPRIGPSGPGPATHGGLASWDTERGDVMITRLGSSRVHSSRGAASMEYVGAFALVASLVVAVILSVPDTASASVGVIQQAICRVQEAAGAGGPCTGQPDPEDPPPPVDPDFDPKPEKCKVTEHGEKVNSEIKIAFVKFGENAGFIETTYSDGTVTYTATDGASLGVTGGFRDEAGHRQGRAGRQGGLRRRCHLRLRQHLDVRQRRTRRRRCGSSWTTTCSSRR